MEKLSGLVLDVYDDPSGDVFRSIFPTKENVPELLKQAHFITPEERQELPDRVFSLVLHNDGEVLRKYACTDGGNTALSVEYFLKTASKLPQEAQKVAAENLVEACGWYGIDPPEQLQKIAIGLMGVANLAMTGPQVASETANALKQNKQLAEQSGGMVNPAIAQTVKPQQPT